MTKLKTDQKIDTNSEQSGKSTVPYSGVNASTLTASEILSKLDSDSMNILDSYNNVTYHIQFLYPYYDKDIIIVESAKTDLYIESCEIETYVGQDFRVRNISSAQFLMKLKESQGTTFFDKLKFLQNKFGDGDYKTCEYKISLSFYGYDSNGNGKTKIGGTYTWPVIMTNMDFKIDLFGTTYTIQFCAKSNIAFSDSIGVIEEGGNFSQTTGKLSDILSSLATYMNEKVKTNNGGIQLVSYSFDDKPYSILGVPINTSLTRPFDMNVTNSTSLNPYEDTSFNDNDIQFTTGMQISKFIENLMANSPDAAGLCVNLSNPDCTALVNDNPSTYSITYKIIASVTYTQFDYYFNQYRKDIKYTIVPRISLNPILSTKQVSTLDGYFDNWSLEKFKNIYKYNMLNKKYDYIFTGKNTNVFDFDISGNMNFAINFPLLLGVTGSVTAVTEGQTQSSNISTDLSTPENAKKYMQQHVQTEKDFSQFNIQKTKNTSEGGFGVPFDSEFSSDDIGSNTSQFSFSPYIDDINKNSALSSSTDYSSLSGSSNNSINFDNALSLNSLNNYDSDLTNKMNTEEQAIANFENNKRLSLTSKLSSSKSNFVDDMFKKNDYDSFYIPINFTSQQNNYGYDGSTSDNSNNTRSIYSTIMNQVYSTGTDSLINLQMKIRLDPYWLGCNDQKTKDNYSFDLSNENSYNDYDFRDCCFVLNYNVPLTTSDYNQVTLSRNDMISGIYQVIKVTNVFGGGDMYQLLDGKKIIQTELSKLIKLDK